MPKAQQAQDPELADIGIEPRFIPYIIAVESGAHKRANDSDGLPAEDAQAIVDTLDGAFSSPTVKPESRNRWTKILCEFSRSHGVRPKSCHPSGVALSGREPYKATGSVEVWKGKQGGNQICVKTFRVQDSDMDEIKEGFYREIVRWKYISHPNVLPFLGVLEKLPSIHGFCIINHWLENGDILGYIKMKPEANRFQLLAQATRGLMHLHSLTIVHGSINPGNILITKEGDVRLADFGIAQIITGCAAARSGSMATYKRNVVRYKAPELLGDNPVPLKESDVYSLTMITFEVLSGVPPYDKKSEPLMAHSIKHQVWPTRPRNRATDIWLPDTVWDAIKGCWGGDPQSRSSLDSLHRTFVGSKPVQKDSATVAVNGANGPGRMGRRSTDTDPLSDNPPGLSNPTVTPPEGINGTSNNPPTQSSGMNGRTPDNSRTKDRINHTPDNPPISNQPAQSSDSISHALGNRQTSFNQAAQSSDRIGSTSKKTRSLKRAKDIWYYCTCRCLSE